MSRKNKTEKASSALWKDQATMAAVAKQKTAQEGQANQGSGDTAHQEGQGGGEPVHQGAGVMSHDVAEMRRECRCDGRPGVSHEVEASGDMTLVCGGHTRTDMSEDDASSSYLNDIPQMSTTPAVDTESHDRQASQAPDTRERGRVSPSQNCYSSGQESLTSPLDAQYGSGSIPPMFELECDGTGDDEVFDTSCHGDNDGDDDDDDDSSRDRPEHSHDISQPIDIRRHDASQPVDIRRHDASPPVDIPRLTLTPEASPDTRLFFLPPGGSMPSQHRFMGSLLCSAGLSISGQSPLGPDHVMVHEALAWTQRLLTPMQQVVDDPDPPRSRFTSFNPAAQTTSLVTSRDRSQSAPSVMSRHVLERQFGRELRRISDEFHLTYGMGQLRHAQAVRRVNGHRPASFPCNHGNPPGWWQLILAYVSPRQLNHHRHCILETPAESSDPSDSSPTERDQEDDDDPV